MRKTIFASILLVCSQVAYCQERNDTTSSPFLFKSFSNGTVLMKDGKKEPARLNYSPFTSQMFFIQNSKDTLALYELDIIDTAYVGNAKFIVMNKKFYEVITNEKLPILVEYTAKALPVVAVVNYLGTNKESYKQADRTMSDMTYGRSNRGVVYLSMEKNFWLKKDGKLLRVDTQREVAKAFPGKKDDIGWYISDKSIDLKKIEDLQKLVAYCTK